MHASVHSDIYMYMLDVQHFTCNPRTSQGGNTPPFRKPVLGIKLANTKGSSSRSHYAADTYSKYLWTCRLGFSWISIILGHYHYSSTPKRGISFHIGRARLPVWDNYPVCGSGAFVSFSNSFCQALFAQFVCKGLFYLRWSQPNMHRPFKGIQPADGPQFFRES